MNTESQITFTQFEEEVKMSANYILESTCVNTPIDEWEALMKGARKCAKKVAVKAALESGCISPEDAKRELKNPYYNPYTPLRTKTHIIYVNSAIEHFIKIN